jgi:uncharacterized membrane protein
MGPDLPDALHFAIPDEVNGWIFMDALKNESPKAIERQTRWSLILGIVIWFLYLNTLNALTSVSCKWGWFSYNIAGMPGLQFIEALISLVVILLLLGMIFLSWRNWRSYQSKKPADNPQLFQDTEEDRRPLMAFVTMLLNVFFFLFAIATFVPMMTLKACG